MFLQCASILQDLMFADGEKVFITMAAIKLAHTQDEIAFLLGHELAHNILHYVKSTGMS